MLRRTRDDQIVDFYYLILSCFWKMISASDPNLALVETILSISDVVETVTSETETWLKLRDREFAIKAEIETWKFETETRDLTFLWWQLKLTLWKMLQKEFGILPNTKIKVFAVAICFNTFVLLQKICKFSCSLKTLPTFLCKECKDRRWCPGEAPMFWPATQYWSMLFENVEKRRIISFYFKQAHSM